MKKISNKLIIAIALIVITVVIFYFQNIKEYEAEIPMTSVIVATENIPENTIITEDMVQTESRYSEDLLKQKDNLTSTMEKVVGKRTVTPIYKNEEINVKRLLENEEYMDEKDSQEKRMFTILIESTKDKALNIQEGSFIDIWLEPNQNAITAYEQEKAKLDEMERLNNEVANNQEEQPEETEDIENTQDTEDEQKPEEVEDEELKEPKSIKIFEKIRVYGAKTESFAQQLAYSEGDKESEESVTTFLTLYLTDEEISEYLDIEDWFFNKRITLYGENIKYNLVKEQIEEKPQEDATTETSIEEGEMENE